MAEDKNISYPDIKNYRFKYHEERLSDGTINYWAVDENGMYVYPFKDKAEALEKMPFVNSIGHAMYHKMVDKYLIHKRKYPELYAPTFNEANFCHKALMKGFVAYPLNYDPYSNWFGVSRNCAGSPDAMLLRDKKCIVLSLQGMRMPTPKVITKEWEAIANNMDLKYLGFINNGVVEYETYFGELPSEEFILGFIE